jgi:hypothetical protein
MLRRPALSAFLQMRYLIMLLSTDWFWPYGSEIGLHLDAETKAKIQNGCRAIVRNVIAHKVAHNEGVILNA